MAQERQNRSADADRQAEARRVAIFNVKYSPNLGDGLIAECLERALADADCGIAAVSIDLAGRQGYDPRHGARRGTLLRVLEALPASVRKLAVPAMLRYLIARRYRPRWKEALRGCDAAVIGGGALFADADLNFPLKIHAALQECARRNIPVSVGHVGVARNWSRAGRKLFENGLRHVRLLSVTVRDDGSQAAWAAQTKEADLPDAALSFDPGLLASRYFPVMRPETAAVQRIGICLTAPEVLRLHGEAEQGITQDDWLTAMIAKLAVDGRDIVLFTNGSPEDVAYRNRFAQTLTGPLREHVEVAPAFADPIELARFIGTLDGVMAHRLHACIAAYSYRVPSVGLAWDAKVGAFFEQSGRGNYVVHPGRQSPETVAALMENALAEGIDRAQHATLLNRCRADVTALAETLASA
nr:polysaccharide pyruvyl transferase family protein [Stakelama sediminis]